MQRAKRWIVRKVRPLVEDATRPAVHAATREALEELLPAALRDAAGAILQKAADDTLTQATGNSIKVTAAALQVLRSVESSVQASADRLAQQVQDAQAQVLARIDEHSLPQDVHSNQALAGQIAFAAGHQALIDRFKRLRALPAEGMRPPLDLPAQVRAEVRKHAGLPPQVRGDESQEDLLTELRFLWTNSVLVGQMLELAAGRRVLYAGQCYYNLWYLSRALRDRGWKADLLNWDGNPTTQIYYHGEDFKFAGEPDETLRTLRFYVEALYGYDVFHFANAQGITLGWALQNLLAPLFGERGEIHLLKSLGKKVVYTNNGCMDGVSQTAFSRWDDQRVCGICRWQNEPSVCSDHRNLEWGRFRNSVADYQCLLGGNRVDYNDDPRVHEDPWVYCLDPEVWRPDLEIPERFRVQRRTERTLLLYHAVGHKEDRTLDDGVNIKSSHVYLPLMKKLEAQGCDIQLIEPQGVPNRDVRYLQLQADIFLEMLTYGWFGANAREAMMLGKPVICYIRPEWLESLREELPQYAEELPIVSATPETIEEVLLDLMQHPEKRAEIGRRGREFMLRWHSSGAAAEHFDAVYSALLRGDSLLRTPKASAQNVSGINILRRASRP